MQSNEPVFLSFVIPTGAISGVRIVFDGINGNIQMYDAAGHLVVLIDPVGFIELYSTTTGNLIATMDDQGFTSYAASTTGLRTARLQQSGLFIYDVNGDISGIWDDTGIGLQVTPADNFFRFKEKLDGVLEWGSGALARDTNLYRAGANILQTDDTFNAVTDSQVNGISLPRGVVAYQRLTAADVARAAGVNTDMFVTFTADAARLYEVVFKSSIDLGTLAATYAINLSEGGTIGANDGVAVDRFLRINPSESGTSPVHRTASLLYVPTAGVKTIRVRNDPGSGGTVLMNANALATIGSRSLTVKDIGLR